MLKYLVLSLCIWHYTSAAPLARRMVDLTHVFDHTTIYYPTMKKFEMKTFFKGYLTSTKNTSFWAQAEEYTSGIHVGTHMDAPLHFVKDGQPLDQIPISHLEAPAAVVDVTEKAAQNRDYEVTIQDLLDWEQETGEMLNDVILLMRTGWSKRWHDRELFTGSPDVETTVLSYAELHFPGMHPDAARWLVENRNIYGLGTETLSIDNGPSKDFETHITLLSKNIFALENVANLDELPLYGAKLYAMPSKFGGASGAPVRLIASFPKLVFAKPHEKHNEPGTHEAETHGEETHGGETQEGETHVSEIHENND